MTRKDYIAIAAAIRATDQRIKAEAQREGTNNAFHTAKEQLRGVRRAAAALADALADDNPRGFDAQVFLRNCGYAGEVRATQPVPREALDRLADALQPGTVIDYPKRRPRATPQVDRHQRGEILDN